MFYNWLSKPLPNALLFEMEISSTTTETEISREIEMEETAQASSSSAMKSISTASAGTSYPLQGSGSAVKIEEIQGPVYPVERKHEYPKDVPPRGEAKGKDDIKFPVYGVEKSHSFVDKAPYHESDKILQGPSYDVEHSHKFTRDEVIVPNVSVQGSGPVMKGVEAQHKFPEGGKDTTVHSKPQAPQPYPVTDSDHSVKFNPRMDKKPPIPKELMGPKFKDVDIQHSYTGIEKQLDMEEKNLFFTSNERDAELKSTRELI